MNNKQKIYEKIYFDALDNNSSVDSFSDESFIGSNDSYDSDDSVTLTESVVEKNEKNVNETTEDIIITSSDVNSRNSQISYFKLCAIDDLMESSNIYSGELNQDCQKDCSIITSESNFSKIDNAERVYRCKDELKNDGDFHVNRYIKSENNKIENVKENLFEDITSDLTTLNKENELFDELHHYRETNFSDDSTSIEIEESGRTNCIDSQGLSGTSNLKSLEESPVESNKNSQNLSFDNDLIDLNDLDFTESKWLHSTSSLTDEESFNIETLMSFKNLSIIPFHKKTIKQKFLNLENSGTSEHLPEVTERNSSNDNFQSVRDSKFSNLYYTKETSEIPEKNNWLNSSENQSGKQCSQNDEVAFEIDSNQDLLGLSNEINSLKSVFVQKMFKSPNPLTKVFSKTCTTGTKLLLDESRNDESVLKVQNSVGLTKQSLTCREKDRSTKNNLSSMHPDHNESAKDRGLKKESIGIQNKNERRKTMLVTKSTNLTKNQMAETFKTPTANKSIFKSQSQLHSFSDAKKVEVKKPVCNNIRTSLAFPKKSFGPSNEQKTSVGKPPSAAESSLVPSKEKVMGTFSQNCKTSAQDKIKTDSCESLGRKSSVRNNLVKVNSSITEKQTRIEHKKESDKHILNRTFDKEDFQFHEFQFMEQVDDSKCKNYSKIENQTEVPNKSQNLEESSFRERRNSFTKQQQSSLNSESQSKIPLRRIPVFKSRVSGYPL